jgi:hypothetical protein
MKPFIRQLVEAQSTLTESKSNLSKLSKEVTSTPERTCESDISVFTPLYCHFLIA